MSNGRPSGINQRIADRLLAEGWIQREGHQQAVEHAGRQKGRVEDALLELDLISEADLLKFVATTHNTRFVSTEKLSRAAIEPRVLERVPLRLADLHGVFPVLYDDKTGALSIVTADPDNEVAIREVQAAARVAEVRALAGRPAGVLAAIAYNYRGDRNAFQGLLRPSPKSSPIPQQGQSPGPPAGAAPTMTWAQATPVSPAAPPASPPSGRGPRARNRSITPTKIDQFLAPPAAMGLAPGVPAAIPAAAVLAVASKTPSLPPAAPALPPAVSPQLVEALNVLVSLLESTRADLRGHSSMVARLTRKTCERIGLSPLQIAAFTAAAYLHDLGKMGAYHLTALNVSEYEGHRVAAGKGADLPVHLMESVGLLPETRGAITSMYERYDGQGIPHGLAGKDIPLGARILSVADTYADLIQNPRNPYRKILRPFEACEVLLQYRGTVFDPNIVDIFRQSTTGEDMRAKLLSDRHEALIVDSDPEETTVLELRLIEQGFEVKIARTVAQAKKILSENEIDAVVSEIDLDVPDAGIALREELLKDGRGRDITWVVLTGKSDRQSAQRCFDLGVDDFVLKPVSTDIFAAKLRQLIERRQKSTGGSSARGVSGSLTEMSLPDMIQILWHGRKTCALRINASPSSGEIDFSEGQVVDARWDALRGEDAFYKMLTLHEGDFRLDPAYTPSTRSIKASPEALLLEGMRRLDEASA
jgi:response regulator RpfG family c-di-GMP phosphodiesterase